MYTPNIADIKSSYADSRPTTYDYLKPNSFRFTFRDFPHVSYTCQAINLPSLGFGAAKHETPFLDYAIAGEKVTFGDLGIKFIISEDMSNYKELFNWMIGIGNPINYEKYKEYLSKKGNKYPGYSVDKPKTDLVKYTDATLVILTAANNPNISITFKNVFPVQLSALQFDTTVGDIQYLTCDAVFKYEMYEIA